MPLLVLLAGGLNFISSTPAPISTNLRYPWHWWDYGSPYPPFGLPTSREILLNNFTSADLKAVLKYGCVLDKDREFFAEELNMISNSSRFNEYNVRNMCNEFLVKGVIAEACELHGESNGLCSNHTSSGTISVVDRIRDYIYDHDGATIYELKDNFNLDILDVVRYVNTLNYTIVSQNIVIPTKFLDDLKEQRLETATKHLKLLYEDRNMLDRIVAVDELYINRHNVWIFVAFHQNRVLAYRILSQKTRPNEQLFYSFMAEDVATAIREESEKVFQFPGHEKDAIYMLMDHAKAHETAEIRRLFSRHGWQRLVQDPFSPDQNPCRSHGSIALMGLLEDNLFESKEKAIRAFKVEAEHIKIFSNFRGIADLPETWRQILANEGDFVRMYYKSKLDNHIPEFWRPDTMYNYDNYLY